MYFSKIMDKPVHHIIYMVRVANYESYFNKNDAIAISNIKYEVYFPKTKTLDSSSLNCTRSYTMRECNILRTTVNLSRVIH